METTKPTSHYSHTGDLAVDRTASKAVGSTRHADRGSEWTAEPLRPVAHWVLMPVSGGRNRLEMVWEVPDPMPPTAAP